MIAELFYKGYKKQYTMSTRKMLAIVERGAGKRNFTCFTPESIDGYGLTGAGATAREAMEDIKVSLKEMRELAAEEGKELPDVEFDFRFDVGAFFDYYPLDATAVAKYIGISPSLLRQYVSTIKQPTQKQLEKIKNGLESLVQDLGQGLMLSCPPSSYVR